MSYQHLQRARALGKQRFDMISRELSKSNMKTQKQDDGQHTVIDKGTQRVVYGPASLDDIRARFSLDIWIGYSS